MEELKMTETIQQLKEDIALLQMKLQKLEELQRTKTPAEEAYKEVYDWYPPTTPSVSNYEDERWSAFQNGYNASQEPKKEQKWGDIVRESVKWCKEHPDESVEDYLKPQTPEQIEKSLREAFKKVQQTEEWKETQRKIDSNYDELVESGTEPQEPTSTVFRQKLFDGIKSVFYDPDYERTHWKMKVDMAVDEVLTHFYDILPEPQNAAGSQNVDVEFLVDGYNDCLNEIKSKLR
jgi:hypothetical protein